MSVAALLQGRLTRHTVDDDAPLIATPGRVGGSHHQTLLTHLTPEGLLRIALDVLSWAITMLFVGLGWLLFFYPVDRAVTMVWLLFSW